MLGSFYNQSVKLDNLALWTNYGPKILRKTTLDDRLLPGRGSNSTSSTSLIFVSLAPSATREAKERDGIWEESK